MDPASATCAVCQAPLDVSGSPIDLTDDALAALIAGSPVPVLVDFWGPHCPPCRLVAPVVDAVARARAGRLVVVKDRRRGRVWGRRRAPRGVVQQLQIESTSCS